MVVVGAGSFGAWTALNLQRMGARVTLVDQYGPANSRSTSGGETRGVRTSYGDRPHGLQWGRWAAEAARRWKAWDEEHASSDLPRLFFNTGDLIMREEMEPYLEETMANWDAMGHVYYVATPPGDESFRYPNIPSYGVRGATGWPALPTDSRGFRVRTGAHSGDDPDTSVRWIDAEYHDRPRELLAKYFPALAERPFNETRACHYESSIDSNFIIDEHPDFDNAWITGGGSAEAFKQGPVLGEYIAGRVMGTDTDAELAQSFRLKEEEFEEEDERRGDG